MNDHVIEEMADGRRDLYKVTTPKGGSFVFSEEEILIWYMPAYNSTSIVSSSALIGAAQARLAVWKHMQAKSGIG